jgi:CRISPR-associated endonuclease/helicase Cas3
MSEASEASINPNLLWAKSPPADGSFMEGYPLLPHLLDVASVGKVLLSSVPCPAPHALPDAWISALVGLHDLGKASPGFQRRLGRQTIGGYRLERDQPERHDISSVLILANLLKSIGFTHKDASELAHAVGAHHGSPFTSDELNKGKWEIADAWQSAHEALFQGLIDGVGATGKTALPSEPAVRSVVLQWLMGLTTTADWLGSSEALCRWERLPSALLEPKEWSAQSMVLAAEAVGAAGLAPSPLPKARDGATAVRLVLGENRQPRPLQISIANAIDSLPSGPSLIVIEAPMGEGKTEAALGCALGTRGIYLAMPSQATSNALFNRLAEFLQATPTPDRTQRPITLSHSSGGPDNATLKLREIGLDTPDGSVKAGWWFRGGKRTLLCPHGIGTVDQGLLGVLQCRHSFLRLYGLTGRTVIFDEVHAYDSYTGGLIERLVSWLRALGCRVVVMTATLPDDRRKALLAAWNRDDEPRPADKNQEAERVSYPRISWIGANGLHTTAFAASRRQRVLVRSHPRDVEAIAEHAVAWAVQGARVLVVVNKVARAQALYKLLGSVPSVLFHARFPMEQRLEIEQLVLDRFGPYGSATGGHVLVATQVAEQSLDIDFDVLITDPAPIDLLLQRQGRIHRHPRNRPKDFEQPVVYVGDLNTLLPDEQLTSRIYDRWIVLRSIAWLSENRTLELPEDIDRAVQMVYGDWQPDGPEVLQQALDDCFDAHEQELLNMKKAAIQVALEQPDEWRISRQGGQTTDDDKMESGSYRFATRLGSESVSVVPVFPQDLEDFVSRGHVLTKKHLRISDRRLIQHVKAASLPPGWRSTAGLSAHLPLFLDAAGQVLDAPVSARLDPQLGLVVGSSG